MTRNQRLRLESRMDTGVALVLAFVMDGGWCWFWAVMFALGLLMQAYFGNQIYARKEERP